MNKRISLNKKNSLTLRLLYHTIIGRVILKIIILPINSKIIGKILDTKLSTVFIPLFIKKHQINMSDYHAIKYQSFNEFFVREKLNHDFNKKQKYLIAPADAKLSVYKINNHATFKIKNNIYDLNLLLNNQELAHDYQDGYCLIYRLDVSDYHRYLFIDDGEQGNNISIPGKLHTVQPIAITTVPVFTTNHRVYNLLNTKNFNQVIQIEVGALMVGKINNYYEKHSFKRGDLKGEFKFGGSTIIQLFKKDTITINKQILSNTNYNYETIVKIGDIVGEKK